MELQYVSDDEGKQTAVLVPIAEWNKMREDLKKLKSDGETNGKTKMKPSDFAGTLSKEEGEKFHKYLKKARAEWDRTI